MALDLTDMQEAAVTLVATDLRAAYTGDPSDKPSLEDYEGGIEPIVNGIVEAIYNALIDDAVIERTSTSPFVGIIT